MKDIDWNFVIKLKEFTEYLCTKDLLLLSMSCKKSRMLLDKEAFNTFNLHLFTSSKGYFDLLFNEDANQNLKEINIFLNPYKPLTRELIESKMNFIDDLKLLNRNPKRLNVINYGTYHYLLDETPSIFHNITVLVLDNSAFTIDSLQSLLDYFKCLQNLELTENLIFHDTQISNNYTINYPASLRSLKLGECYVKVIQSNIDSVGIKKYIGRAGLQELSNTYQHLPNLATFEYYVLENYPEENGDLFGFVKLNPQLKCLKLSGSYFNFGLFDIIKDYENLTHFEFKCFHHWSNLENYEMPVLRYIKHLHIEVVHEKVDEIFIDNFPNVKELVIESNWDINDDENNLIENFPKLKSLKFISNDVYKSIVKLNLRKLYSLKRLEFNLNYEEASFDDLQWDMSIRNNLKLVTFTKNPNYIPFEKPNPTEELSKYWDFYYFPHKLTFIKNFY